MDETSKATAAPSTQITVVIVDDHELTRYGTKRLLARDRHTTVVGEAASGSDAISLIEELKPDVVILDIRLPDGSGIDVVKAAKKVAPQTKILILSAYDDDRYVRSLMRLGVQGYVLKTISAPEFKDAVREIGEGNLVFPRELSAKVLRTLQNSDQRDDRALSSSSFTAREREVLNHMAEGLSNREIATALGISRRTVESHVQRLLLKLGAASRTQAVVTALRNPWLQVGATGSSAHSPMRSRRLATVSAGNS